MEVASLPIKEDNRVSLYSAHFTRQGEQGKYSKTSDTVQYRGALASVV